jgi:hypothetical protein
MTVSRLERANDGKHKWTVFFSDGRKTKIGAEGMDDYTITHDKEQRERYIKRHAKDLKTNDPYRAGFLSMGILWGPTTSIHKNIELYNKKYFS